MTSFTRKWCSLIFATTFTGTKIRLHHFLVIVVTLLFERFDKRCKKTFHFQYFFGSQHVTCSSHHTQSRSLSPRMNLGHSSCSTVHSDRAITALSFSQNTSYWIPDIASIAAMVCIDDHHHHQYIHHVISLCTHCIRLRLYPFFMWFDISG